MSTLNLTTTDPVAAERASSEKFSRHHGADRYRRVLDFLYGCWHEHNRTYFRGTLRAPHLAVGSTPPRRYSCCRLTTDYGGSMLIAVSEGVAFGTNRRVVVSPWPSEGTGRFLSDLVLGETVRQYVLEVIGDTEDGYGGYGPVYAREATRIGEALGLPPVVARRRGPGAAGLPVAAFWPWAFRPEGYYLGHVQLASLSVRGSRRASLPLLIGRPPGMFEYLLHLLTTDRIDRLRQVLARAVDAERERRSPALAASERGPYAPRRLLREWVTWNDACVARMARFVQARRAFDVMPILADALEDAGCDDQVVLEHCRCRSEHTTGCWVLREIESAAEAAGVGA